mmetsp:Transcript_79438/g.174232  ORF Transcript_79438/g.174232 Transcript_79438/m.174232 type:complete len:104 (+) Transcript_79438:113-424(+)
MRSVKSNYITRSLCHVSVCQRSSKAVAPPTTVESSQAAAWVFGFRLLEASSLRCDDHLKTDEKSTEKEQSREDFGVSSGSVAGTAAAALQLMLVLLLLPLLLQ